jgi:hypothetical protein
LKDKRYFYEKHITGERISKPTDPMKMGSAVDTIVTRGWKRFAKEFTVPKKRNLQEPPKNITELTPSQYEDVVAMGKILLVQPFYNEIKKYKKQQILHLDMDLGPHFTGLAAIPDFYQIKDGVCDIVDLKTAADADAENSGRKYLYKCLDFGYFRQFAVMQIIFKATHPEIKSFQFWHFVIEKNIQDGIFLPYVYRLANERVEWHVNEVMGILLPAIKAEREFNAIKAERKNAILIGAVDDYED